MEPEHKLKGDKENVVVPEVDNYESDFTAPRKRLADWDRYQVVDRGAWWKCDIKPTPDPCKYVGPDFIDELEKNPIKNTYRFKTNARKNSFLQKNNGQYLLPGAYSHQDSLQILDKSLQNSCAFKGSSRFPKNGLTEGLVDKDLTTCPGQYDVESYLSIDGSKQTSKHAAFKDRSVRLPPSFLKPREGPDPGQYNYLNGQKYCVTTFPTISSSFKNRAPRFVTAHSKVPGPGTYDKSYQSPMPPEISKLGRQRGLFFTCSFTA